MTMHRGPGCAHRIFATLRSMARHVSSLAFLLLVGCRGSSQDGWSVEDGCRDDECDLACRYVGHDEGGICVGDDCVCVVQDASTDGAVDPGLDGSPDTCDIDILFVIDTSGSMMDAAENLAHTAFPAFAEQLRDHPDLAVYRVAVTNHLYGESEVGDGVTVDDTLFLTMGWPPEEPHEFLPCQEVPTVDCAFESGQSWMVGPSASLEDEFRCVGSVACHQSIALGEPTLQAGLEALTYTGNAGFLREDALLALVFITDEDDQSTLSLDEIRREILALKGGDPRYVVVLTLGGPVVGTEEVNPLTHAMGCMSDDHGAIEQTPRIIDFAISFGSRGLHYNLCEDDISTALTSAIDALEISCRDILI